MKPEIKTYSDVTLFCEKKETNSDAGLKFDDGKPMLAFLPPLAIMEVGKAFTHGAKKYGDFNYMKGLSFTRLLSAALRHLFLFLSGKNIDDGPQGSGCAHWACAVANLLILGEIYFTNPKKFDDRFKHETTSN